MIGFIRRMRINTSVYRQQPPTIPQPNSQHPNASSTNIDDELNIIEMATQQSTIPPPQQSTHSDINIIEMATQNLKQRIVHVPIEKVCVYSTNGENNECPICTGAYSSLTPAIIMECGHIWCSRCIKRICRPTTCACPICRSIVSFRDSILYDIDIVIVN